MKKWIMISLLVAACEVPPPPPQAPRLVEENSQSNVIKVGTFYTERGHWKILHLIIAMKPKFQYFFDFPEDWFDDVELFVGAYFKRLNRGECDHYHYYKFLYAYNPSHPTFCGDFNTNEFGVLIQPDEYPRKGMYYIKAEEDVIDSSWVDTLEIYLYFLTQKGKHAAMIGAKMDWSTGWPKDREIPLNYSLKQWLQNH